MGDTRYQKMRILVLVAVIPIASQQIGPVKYFSDVFRIFNHIPFDTTKFVENKSGSVLRGDLVFYLSSRNDQNYVVVNDDFELINPKWKIKMLVHGWTEHADVVWAKNATSAYLRYGDYNVIAVDWSKIGDNDYVTASINVYNVGATIGDWIINVHDSIKVPYKNFHLISHSLGCQVASFIGKRVFEITGKKIGRITALDPAAPIFDLMGPERRLDKEDAKFVDVVHTDGGVLGFKYPIGHADFFPNGGNAIQSGCSLLKPDIKYEDLFCSHAKSHHFFIETINAKLGHARSCSSWNDFNRGTCDANKSIVFGEHASSKLRGTFYLKTDPDGISEE